MRIAYFDEGGIASEEQEPFLIVAAVAFHGDRQWHAIEAHTSEIIRILVPKELQSPFYFHATHLYGDHKSFKGLISAELRFQILRELLKVIIDFELPISYGAVNRTVFRKYLPKEKPKARTTYAHQIAFSLCTMGLQGWFNREHGDEVAICVADQNDAMKLTLKQDYAAQRRYPLPNNPLIMLFNFVDALHFAASEESIGLQLADSAAFIIKRHLMGKSNTEDLYKMIECRLVCELDSALLQLSPDIR